MVWTLFAFVLIATVVSWLWRLFVPPPVRQPDTLWDDDTPIDPHHALVPDAIRAALAPHWSDGCSLFRSQTTTGIEWYFFDPDGELIDIYWLK